MHDLDLATPRPRPRVSGPSRSSGASGFGVRLRPGVRTRVGLAVALALAAGACGDDAAETEPPRSAEDPAEIAYAPGLEVDIEQMDRSQSGLYTRTLTEGEGEPAQPGDSLFLHYTGWLPDGEEFDSSRGGDPFAIRLAETSLIAGWTEGVEGMRPGETRMLVIPPDLGYGSSGSGGVIPPNATLVFRVELVENRGGGSEGSGTPDGAGSGGATGG